MPLAPTTSASLVDQAIDGMRALLASGEWTVGTRIPPEPVLGAALGVSRNTVREAVKALAHVGLLEVRRGDGTYVAAATEMQALMRRQVDRVELAHLLEHGLGAAGEHRLGGLHAQGLHVEQRPELGALAVVDDDGAVGVADQPAELDARVVHARVRGDA